MSKWESVYSLWSAWQIRKIWQQPTNQGHTTRETQNHHATYQLLIWLHLEITSFVHNSNSLAPVNQRIALFLYLLNCPPSLHWNYKPGDQPAPEAARGVGHLVVPAHGGDFFAVGWTGAWTVAIILCLTLYKDEKGASGAAQDYIFHLAGDYPGVLWHKAPWNVTTPTLCPPPLRERLIIYPRDIPLYGR